MTVAPGGKLTVDKIVVVADCGHVVDPRNSEMQMESDVIFGLTAALYGKISIANGAVEQSNFHDYEMVRIEETQKLTFFSHRAEAKNGEAWRSRVRFLLRQRSAMPSLQRAARSP